MVDQTKSDKLWTPRSVEETQKIYADWADTYENDVTTMAYATPDRIAVALLAQSPDLETPVLDFGCGTGLSGFALRKAGFRTVDGSDISPEMLAHAEKKAWNDAPVYRRTWLGDPNVIGVTPSSYNIIVATGVISLGAAPPEILAQLLDALTPGGLLAFSYNDPTLAEATYIEALDLAITSHVAELKFREHGPHLNEKVTGSDVIVLRRL